MTPQTTGGQLHIDPRKQYRAVRVSALAASPLVVAGMVVLLAGIGTTIGVIVSGVLALQVGAGVMFVLAGLLAAGMWLFAYGVTFRPYQAPPATINEVVVGKGTKNIADAADRAALALLGQSYRHGYAEDLDILFNVLLKTKAVQQVVARLELAHDELQQIVRTQVVPDLSWSGLVHLLTRYLAGANREYVSTIDLFTAFLMHPRLRNFLRQHSLQEEDVLFVAWWQNTQRELAEEKSRWWSKNTLLDFSGIGLSWAAGYTPFVDAFSRPPRGSAWDVGWTHAQEVEVLMNSLARRQQSNVLLVGQPGVGRIGVVKELMERIATGRAHPALANQRVVYVHVSQLVSMGTTAPSQLAVVSRALNEMEQAGNIIAVLDGLGAIVGGEDGNVNVSEILVPFFSSQSVRVVVVMSSDDYHQRIAGNQELEHLFEIVEVPPLSSEATLQLLALSVEAWEKESNVFVPYRTLQEIVESTSSILPHIPFPEKAFDILEELVVETQGNKKKVITSDDVHSLIARKTGVHFGRIKAEESQRLLSLSDYIHRRVVNQEQGVEAVVRAMVRARTGVRSRTRPIGSFLFLGPTGVGKTETAKALAEVYFGSDEYLQRLDMSEFQGEDAIDRLLGTVQEPMGRLPSMITSHPFSVLLLDEFEKASRTVQELFLPLFDEGYITDARGRRYSFVHTILIATSNAGAELIRNEVKDDGKLPEGFDMQLRENILSNGVFLPELLNRFDGVVTFTPLSPEHIRQIAHIMLADFNKRLDAEHGITVRITQELIDYLASAGYDPQFGARPMRRLIQDVVEYTAAQYILSGRVEAGQEIVIPIPQVAKAQNLKHQAQNKF